MQLKRLKTNYLKIDVPKNTKMRIIIFCDGCAEEQNAQSKYKKTEKAEFILNKLTPSF